MSRLKLTTVLAFVLSISSVLASWEILDLPTDRGFTAIWAIDEQSIFAIGNQGLWSTFDGNEWVLDNTYQPSYIYFADDTLGFLWGSILTIDGGHTWQKGDTVNGNVVRVRFARGQSLVGYGLGYDYVSKTTDGGWHWSQLPSLPDVYPGFDEIISPGDICFPEDPDTGYLTAICIKKLSESEIEPHASYFITEDGGQTWTLNEEGLWNDDFNPGYIAFPENATVGYMTGGSDKLFKTTDGGVTWDTVLKDLPHIASICYPKTDQVGYVFGDSLVHKTIDGGKTWRMGYLTHDSIWGHSHFLNDSVGFVTGKGPEIMFASMPYYPGFVMKTTDGLLGIAEEDWENVIPELVELGTQAIFSDEFVVSYSLKAQGRLKASLYDAAGREVETYGWNNVRSSGTFNFNGGGLASGVYFVKVEFNSTEGNQIKTIRAVKVR
ncbi:hypothetical protein JXM67_13180 [candidate division WOR-3 bacterium]|nr:hypothetical protein [candidate division WOR-3 bacterium]